MCEPALTDVPVRIEASNKNFTCVHGKELLCVREWPVGVTAAVVVVAAAAARAAASKTLLRKSAGARERATACASGVRAGGGNGEVQYYAGRHARSTLRRSSFGAKFACCPLSPRASVYLSFNPSVLFDVSRRPMRLTRFDG